MILQVIKVAGRSLEPRYRDGDFVIVSRIPILLRGIRPGDAVVFHHPGLGLLIKLVERLEENGERVFVVGLDPTSRDSRAFGALPRSLVLAIVIGHIRK